MKWLKKFEEVKLKYKKSETGFDTGLSPSVYRNAATKLSRWNKSNRADELSDWADKKQYGFYNLNIGSHTGHSTTSIQSKNITFTSPHLVGVYYLYDSGKEENIPTNLLRNSDKSEELAERMVNDWVRGDISCLSLSFEFGFRPTKQTIRRGGIYKNLSWSDSIVNKWNHESRNVGSIFPTFRINLILTEDSGGMEDYYTYEEDLKRSVSQFYEDTKYEYITISRPFIDQYYGIFADRRSAIDFKKYFLSIINESQLSINVKSFIMNVISIINGETSDVERIMNKLNNIRIHGLYDDEIDSVGSDNISDRWFEIKFKSTTPYGKKIN